jgi:hypothetical protein
MRFLVIGLCAVALSACEPTIPDSGAGVGFDGYSDLEQERAGREAELAGSVLPLSSTAISDETVLNVDTETEIAAAPIDLNNPAISDEQDFSAVASRESIESDRQRLDVQSQAYQTIQPTALPTRNGKSGLGIVEFALSTTNTLGQSTYRRAGVASQSRFNRNCAKYGSSDLAQIDFLKSGGPQKDRKGLDPDGDGFACYWDPTPFRRAVSN